MIQRWIGAHLFQIVPRAKGFALGRNDNYTKGFIVRDHLKLTLQLRKHPFRQSVKGLLPVERQRDHTSRVLRSQHDWLCGFREFRARRWFDCCWSSFHRLGDSNAIAEIPNLKFEKFS